MSKLVGSTAYVVSPERYVRILDAVNPESLLVRGLNNYVRQLGFTELYPNFAFPKVNLVHPFALALWADIAGSQLPMDLFPSITVQDSNASDNTETLGVNVAYYSLNAQEWTNLKTFVGGRIHISETGISKVDAKIAGQGYVFGAKKLYFRNHDFDFNIWTENRDVTGFLFDVVTDFLKAVMEELHREYEIDLQSVSGRRGGDINVEFGNILYGANVRASATVYRSSMLIDLDAQSIAEIQNQATYSVIGG